MTRPIAFTIQAIREGNAAAGGHWFDPAAMRFFRCRVLGAVFTDDEGCSYFVTSEQGPHGPRAYSVRRYDRTTGAIATVGAFQAYSSPETARTAAKRAAKGGAL